MLLALLMRLTLLALQRAQVLQRAPVLLRVLLLWVLLLRLRMRILLPRAAPLAFAAAPTLRMTFAVAAEALVRSESWPGRRGASVLSAQGVQSHSRPPSAMTLLPLLPAGVGQ